MFTQIAESDLDALLALNNAHMAETGPLDRERLSRMIGAAFCARTNESHRCLLIAFDQAASYDSPNFLWFRDRFAGFVYVDRIIVAASARGTGIARALYSDLFMLAQAAGHDTIVCEVNRIPPNPDSDAFHAALGFVEVGHGAPIPGKQVRYMKRALSLANQESRA